jgi:hypothetical protein
MDDELQSIASIIAEFYANEIANVSGAGSVAPVIKIKGITCFRPIHRK